MELQELVPYLTPGHVAQLVEIRKSLIAIRKVRKKGAPAAFRRLILMGRPGMEQAAKVWQKMIRSAVLRKLGVGAMRGTPAQIADRLANWPALEKEGRQIFDSTLRRLYIIGAKSIKFKAAVKVDPITSRAVKWAQQYSAKLVTQITDETRGAIRAYTAEAIKSGRDLGSLGRELRSVIGLNEKQGESLSNYYTDLQDSGLSEAEMDALLEKEGASMLIDRAIMIARTETAASLSEGTLGAYGEHGISEVEWAADPSACPEICLPNNGQVYSIEEASGEIPAHPNCECCWVMAIEGGGAASEE
jgi:hypothetical protein